MKLSFILELLLIFILVSFAASRTVQRQAKLIRTSELLRQNDENNLLIDSNDVTPLTESPIIDDDEDVIEEESSGAEEPNAAAAEEAETNDVTEAPINVDDRPPINKYCSCSNAVCTCCRDFSLPIVPVRGPGCAEIKYMKNDRLSVTVKYGDFVLANRIVKAGTSKPICIPLPGGFSRFCGRIYGVQRVKEDFKACLGLELRADEEVEAALKVSCFKFGERGLAVTEADPLPAIESETGGDDDEDDDLFGLGGSDDDDGDADDDDDDDDEDDEDSSAGGEDDDLFGLGGDDDDDDDDADDESASSDDSPDYSGFSLISDGFDGIFGDDDDGQKKKKVAVKTKNNNASIEVVSTIKNTTSADTNKAVINKNDKDAIAPVAAVERPVTAATVSVSPTKPKKKKPSGGILDALLGDDDEDDDDDDGTDEDEEDDDDDDDEDDEEKEEADNTDKDEESDDTETAEPEEDNKDEVDDYKEETDDLTENVDDEENGEEGIEDDEDVATNETDDSQKINSSDTNKKKKKDDYYGYLSRLMKIF